ncbi:MAG: ABC transporter permease, partial [Acidobacteriota bacterium]|nr:ABC transporter permease [Acidobacteriota bacterium]
MMLNDIVYRFRSLFRRGAAEAELDEELRFHIEQEAEKREQSGLPRAEALRQARLAFGPGDQTKEECREARGVSTAENLVRDLHYGLRQLARNPGFAVAAVVVLALGIGANVAIFCGLNGLFLRPLPVKNPNQLVEFAFGQRGALGEFNFSYPDFRDLRDQMTTVQDIFAYRFGVDGLSDGHHAGRIVTSFVTGNYFAALGLKPALGRLISSEEGNPAGSNPVLVLGYSYWRSRFGGDPRVIGRQVNVDGHAVTIIGVAPKDFRGLLSIVDMQAYLPINMAAIAGDEHWTEERHTHDLFVFGRLMPGTSLKDARASLAVIGSRLSREYPKIDAAAALRVFPEKDARLSPQPQPGHYARTMIAIWLFLGMAVLLLLLACFNVANIFLVRSTAREHEMAVRAALGASRGRLARQVLAESFLAALLGGGAGILAGAWASRLLSSINFNVGIPYHLDFGLDWRVFAYACAAVVVAAILVGVVPALRAARASAADARLGESRTFAAPRHRLRNTLVAAQIAVSMVLLIAAGLFARSLGAVEHIDLGFHARRVLNLTMNTHEAGYNGAQAKEFYKELLAGVRALPGIRSASLAAIVPLSARESDDAIYVEGRLPPPGQPATRFFDNQVSPGYFETMGISIVRGRAFTEADKSSTRLVAIVNQTMASRLWPNEDPIGRRFKMYNSSNPWTTVVGVARDSKYRSILDASLPYFYLPLSQDFSSDETLEVRTLRPPETMAREIERQIHRLAPDLPVSNVQTMEQAMDTPWGIFDFHLGKWLAGVIGLIGLMLAIVGIYGVVSYAASRRTHEIGIRMALGAQP